MDNSEKNWEKDENAIEQSTSTAGSETTPVDTSSPENQSPLPSAIKFVRNAAFAAATEKQKPSPWTKNMFQLYLCIIVAAFTPCMNAYNNMVITYVNRYEGFREYFGFDIDAGAPSTNLIHLIYPIGSMSATLFTVIAADYKGRKYGMFVGGLICFIFSIVSATSRSYTQLVVARFFIGFGNALAAATSGPSYVAELAHPSYRGVLVGLYNTCWQVGGISSQSITYGASHIGDERSWRLPLWCEMFFPGLLVAGSLFLPESPRWLIANDREEEALDIMAKYHGDGDRESAIVVLEFQEIKAELYKGGTHPAWWDYRDLVNTRETRWRLMIVFSFVFITQLCGGASNYYYPQEIAASGISQDPHTSFMMGGLGGLATTIGAITGSVFTDTWGRRKGFLTALCLFVLIFTIQVPVIATNLRTVDGAVEAIRAPQARAYIAMQFIWGIVFCTLITPLQALYLVECLRYDTRAKGLAAAGLFSSATSFYNSFATGIAFEGIGWKYYFVFIGFDICAAIFAYFFFVETSKRTLEELTEIFRARRPVKTSLTKSKIVIQGDDIIWNDIDSIY